MKNKKISLFEKFELKRRGKKDGKKKAYRPSDFDNSIYDTPYIGTYIANFMQKEHKIFTDLIENKLKELNLSINNQIQQRDNAISNAKTEIDKLKDEIDVMNTTTLSSSDKAIIRVKENKIVNIKRKLRKDLDEINKQGIANNRDANETKQEFDKGFIKDLNFIREKLTLYWDSLFAICNKIDPNIQINVQLPTDDKLINMYEIKNPSSDFKVESYGIISLDDFDNNI